MKSDARPYMVGKFLDQLIVLFLLVASHNPEPQHILAIYVPLRHKICSPSQRDIQRVKSGWLVCFGEDASDKE
jgi:hypothetical protein